jgi:hypothetical protein
MIVACLEGQCRLTGLSGAFTDLATGQQAEIPGAGQDPTPAQPIDAAQLADWIANVPEAQAFAVTLTPGPPPTSTPTQTPTPTATATLTPPQLVQTLPLQAAEGPAGIPFTEAAARLFEPDTLNSVSFRTSLSLARVRALGFQAGYVTEFNPDGGGCQAWCQVTSQASVFTDVDGAATYLSENIATVTFDTLAPVDGLGEEAYRYEYTVAEGLNRTFAWYEWRSGAVVFFLQAVYNTGTAAEADVRALADRMQAHLP